MDVAEKKLSMNDYFGAKKFVNKAQNLYPELDGLKQVLTMIHVYISASKKTKGEADWYRVFGVDPLADDETVKKQYKKLALLLHPDKNKCNGAEEAFKLVSEAWCLLSDKAKRIAYDQKWKTKTGMQRPPNPHKPRSNTPAPADWSQKNRNAGVDPSGSNKPKPPPADWSQKHVDMFWTMCNECKTQCRLVRDHRLNKVILCPNCGQSFTATEITQWSSPQQQQQQQRSAETKARNKTKKVASGSWINVSPANSKTQKTPHDSAKSQATNNNTNEASSSSSPSATKKPKLIIFFNRDCRLLRWYRTLQIGVFVTDPHRFQDSPAIIERTI
ncbi:hypothetical protein AALP_AA2G169400 [Arabis alpina]|uniref:J domain-containing protein n=1 Tax=Arabis alpina TaxID=50452 RepID=A0A087HI14_ARAAL|nr:hypothetical protein AALP_AA2G169400 [Arabis alpina]